MIDQYLNEISHLIAHITKKEKDSMAKAASKLADAIQHDGVIHLFGSGHSHMLAEELYYRAGGLVPINPILHEPLMLHEDAVHSSALERRAHYAESFMQTQDIRDSDVLFVISTSGRNTVPIDVALLGQAKGAYVIGVTSIAYANSQHSRHASGKKLYHVVDLVIDTHVPKGDALLAHDKVPMRFSPASTVIGAAILNAVVAQAIAEMAEQGFEPPIFQSGNLEGADAHNERLIEKYGSRVPL
ncbi:MAG TPA: SIS domain-containing protein [Bacillota bacterium]|nr:SIS domain-containing protein [Bacillota bacterium]